ncbi:hypothetical protein LMJ53_00870 [Rheinheimera sp. UJ51]|uniref:hypothetical protein n=1 Tax=Rheinheimera sp. UJ51 TaxID=2892446 RepID=UPI001E300CC7|nr:hypothetical protein [Rheinheimera sp. UJ51]MCC5450286.1 hypothetical protein [Rheinheimera sp. UJ51]
MENIHLVSFADGPFQARAAGFKKEAESLDLFTSISVFDWATLSTDFADAHGDFALNNPRGFGYWIWKPQVTLQVMENSKPGDIIVYMDVGFELNSCGRYRFLEYCKLAKSNVYQQLAFSNTHTEYRWTKQDLAGRLNLAADSPEMLSTQLAAGFFILINNEENKKLVRLWRDIAVEQNYHFSDDSPSSQPNHEQFIEHRHDASIFSLLRKIKGTFVTHYEVQKYPHFDSIKQQLPAWASRKK